MKNHGKYFLYDYSRKYGDDKGSILGTGRKSGYLYQTPFLPGNLFLLLDICYILIENYLIKREVAAAVQKRKREEKRKERT